MLTVHGTYKNGVVRIKKKLKEGTEVTVVVHDTSKTKLSWEDYLETLDRLEGSWSGNKKIEKAFRTAHQIWKKWNIKELS